MEISGIYGIYNKAKGIWYIGQSSDVLRRFGNHKSNLRHNNHENKHLQRAFNKYGEDAFEFQIFEICPIEQLNEREQFWIAEKDSFYNGYNQTLGGDGVRGMISPKRKPVVCLDTGEVFESILAASRSIGVPKTRLKDYLHKGKRCHGYWELLPDNYSEEWRIRKLKERLDELKVKRSQSAKKGRETYLKTHPPKPKHVNQNGYHKWSDEARKGDKRNKPVVQLTLDGEYVAEYQSCTIASEKTGASRKKIGNVCNKKGNTTFGFKWMWKDEYYAV